MRHRIQKLTARPTLSPDPARDSGPAQHELRTTSPEPHGCGRATAVTSDPNHIHSYPIFSHDQF